MAGVLCPVVVGREAETETLRAALAGAGRLVVLSGEPGVGKSRLARELVAEARRRGFGAVTGRAVSAGRADPYRPLTEALAQALRHRRVPDNPDLRPWLPALAAILPPGAVAVDGHGDESAAVRGEAVLHLLQLLADPVLLVVLEDLHWADPDTLGVVEYLGDNLAGSTVVCVATTRTEPRSDAMDLLDRLAVRGAATAVPLARLGRSDAAAMVRACAPDASPADVDRIAAAADGVPLFVEELLASPGLPMSFAETIRARLADLGSERAPIVQAAAVLGRDFDWRLLAGIADVRDDEVDAALEGGVALQLITVDGARFRFRHALTREAVVATLLPPRRAALARAAMAVVETGQPDLVADLAIQAGDLPLAASLLTASGRAACDRGAGGPAGATLRRASDLGSEDAGPVLVEALALAGRIDEAVVAGDAVIDTLRDGARTAEMHLTLAHAAVSAGRWSLASEHLDVAERLIGLGSARAEVLRAEVAINDGDAAAARVRAEAALAVPGCPTPVRCHALELIGRSHRTHDLDEARTAFDEALRTATEARLPVWRLRALHELGTIEMFDHAGTARLLEARRAADELGVLSTGAMLDMHLAAALMMSFQLDDALGHAQAAAEMSGRLSLARLRALSLMFLAQIHAMRLDRPEMERFLALAAAAAPGDVEIEGSGWAGSRGMVALLEGDREGAIKAIDRGVAMLRTVPLSGPACYRGLYPLLLAVAGDRRAADAIADARNLGMSVNRGNRGLLALAEAVLAGPRGDPAAGFADLAHFHGWSDLARTLVADAGPHDRLDAWGVTERERDVLGLVAEGLANKEIAARLALSPRTVEKHVESLLRKTGTRSRTHLVAVAGGR